MTPDAAVWVRANAWTDAMRRGLTSPSNSLCACQDDRVTGWACASDQHDRCDYGEHPDFETAIWRLGTVLPASLPEPMRHQPRTPFGSRTMAMVWLADRTCRRVCSCPCHTVPAVPEPLTLFGVAELARL